MVRQFCKYYAVALTISQCVSGAGKTTLLDVLATRTSIGVITGEMLVNGKPRDICAY